MASENGNTHLDLCGQKNDRIGYNGRYEKRNSKYKVVVMYKRGRRVHSAVRSAMKKYLRIVAAFHRRLALTVFLEYGLQTALEGVRGGEAEGRKSTSQLHCTYVAVTG